MQVASFWPGLFVSAMQGQDMNKLVCSLPDGGADAGGGGGGAAAPAAAAAGKAPEGEPDHLNRLNLHSSVPGGPARTCVILGNFPPQVSNLLFWRCTRLFQARKNGHVGKYLLNCALLFKSACHVSICDPFCVQLRSCSRDPGVVKFVHRRSARALFAHWQAHEKTPFLYRVCCPSSQTHARCQDDLRSA